MITWVVYWHIYQKVLKSQSLIIISEKANEYKEDVTWLWQCMPETQHTAGRVGKIINEFEASLVYMLNLRRTRAIQ